MIAVNPMEYLMNLVAKDSSGKFGKSIISGSTLEQQNKLLRQYNQALIDIEFGMRRRDIKHKDRIDLRNVLNPKDDHSMTVPVLKKDPEFNEFIKQNGGFYSCIPPFEEAVFQVNDNRYLYYNIDEIIPEKQTVRVFLQDYMAFDGIWSIGIAGTVELNVTNEFAAKVVFFENDIYLYPRIYKLVPYEDLGWNKDDIKLWEKVIITYATVSQQKLNEQDTNNIVELAKYFVSYCGIINFHLSKNKPKLKDRKQKPKTNRKNIVETNTEQQPERRIRMVGNINVSSVKPPKQSTKDTVAHYRTATWKVCGHVRRYKSGKTVYIKPSTRHRKCLQDQNQQQTPTTILKIKG